MDCYSCKYRGEVSGSAHSSCGVIDELSEDKAGTTLLKLLLAGNMVANPVVKLNPHGVASGWAMWPINFDPVWVDDCKAYKLKE